MAARGLYVSADAIPDLDPALRRLLADIPRRCPALAHVQASTVLPVLGAAHEDSRATIRPLLSWRVTVGGHRRLYEISLRPLFFLSANGLGRLCTLFHELYHISPPCDGKLDPQRSHSAGARFDARVEVLAREYVQVAPPALLAPLAHHGMARMRAWRLRPGPGLARNAFTAAHTYSAPLVMQTPAGQRSVWW